MTITLDRLDLKALVKGSFPDYDMFTHPLIVKAGHEYSDQYGKTSWRNLDKLDDRELWSVYSICKIGLIKLKI